MFDIKKFLAENTITLNEDPNNLRLKKHKELTDQFHSTQEQVRKASERYIQWPDKGAINEMRHVMKPFEKIAAELLKGV